MTSLQQLKTTCPQLALFVLLLTNGLSNYVAPARAQDTHVWNDSNGGTWSTFSNWTPVGIPSSADVARFDLNADYTVSFIESGQTKLVQVLGGDVTFESSGIFPGDRNLVLEDAFISNLGELLIRRDSSDWAMIMSTSDDMTVRGTMTVANGAELDNQSVVVDRGVGGSTARLTVEGVGPSGARARWDATELLVGNLARGVVRVADRGFVLINGPATLGAAAGGEGEVVVTGRSSGGTSSDFRTVGTLTIGAAGNGTLRLEGGGAAATAGAILGSESGGRGTVTVENNGPGNPSFWAAGNLNVRRGDIAVNSGGSLRTTSAIVGQEETSSITVSGSGTGSTLGLWDAQGNTTISNSADASLNIEHGGLAATNHLFVGDLAGGVGRVNVSSGPAEPVSTLDVSGNLELGGPEPVGGVGHLNLNTNSLARVDDTITIYAGSSVVMGPNSQLIARTIDNSNGGFFDFLRGTLNTRNYTGDLVNQEGTFSPYAPGLANGSGSGLTTVDGDYTQQSGATLAIDINGSLCGVSYDHVNVTGDAILGGALQLTMLDSFAPDPTDTFDILSANALTGQFDNVSPGARLATTDGLGSFLVNYGPNSPFSAELVVLSDFMTALSADFNSDGAVDCLDIDALVADIAAGANTAIYDLTGDGAVSQADLTAWLQQAGAVNLPSGSAYLPGDANLDGFVNGPDFVAWNDNKFTSGAGWCGGDFNADGFTNGPDFVVWNDHKFTSADANVAAVPEPAGYLLAVMLLATVVLANRPATCAHPDQAQQK